MSSFPVENNSDLLFFIAGENQIRAYLGLLLLFVQKGERWNITTFFLPLGNISPWHLYERLHYKHFLFTCSFCSSLALYGEGEKKQLVQTDKKGRQLFFFFLKRELECWIATNHRNINAPKYFLTTYAPRFYFYLAKIFQRAERKSKKVHQRRRTSTWWQNVWRGEDTN